MEREQIREAILDAAERLLARHGYRKMTMDDLARAVGIGKGTLYLYFPSKQEIALSHIDRLVNRVKEQLLVIAREEKAAAAPRLREMLIARVLVRFDSVQHYTESLNDLLSDLRPQLLARRQIYFAAEARIFAEVIKQGQRQRAFAEGDAHAVAHLLLVATNSLLPYSLSTRELGARAEIEAKAARLADLLLEGLNRRKARA